MKQPKPNINETGKIQHSRKWIGAKLPSFDKYTGKVIKGELYDKNSSGSLR